MKLSAILTGAGFFALAAANAPTTSVATLTSTRTVLRVATATMTGNGTTSGSTGAGNGTATGLPSPTVQPYNPGSSNAASGLSIDLGVAAVVAGAAIFVL